ncbi:MAG: tetratricopeptide repeat protein [Gemmatimonadota bacterium]
MSLARVSAAYGLVALAVLVVARLLIAGGLPAPRLALLVFAAVAGYPLALAAAWLRGGEEPRGSRGGPALAAGLFGAFAVLAAAWIGLRGGQDVTTSSDPGTTAGPPVVVVLPLIELERRGDRYYVDGLTDELAAGVAAIEGVELWGRESARDFVDVNRDAAALGARLGGTAVLDGTVRRSGGRIRLSVRLLETASGEALWSMSRDTTATGFYALRDSVATAVAAAFGLEPDEPTVDRWERRRTDPSTLDLYMLGRFQWASGPRGDLLQAASYYQLALESDTTFVPAWVALAETFATLPRFTRFPTERVRRDGAAAARTALRLDPESHAAHTVLGEILYLYEWDWEGARSHLERARSMAPGEASPRAGLCELSIALGRLDEARSACDAARRRDPLAFRPAWLASTLARAEGRSEVGAAILDSLAGAYPDFEPVAAERVIAHLATGDTAGDRRRLVEWFTLLGPAALADSLALALGEEVGAGAAGAGPSAAVLQALERVASELDPDPSHLAALAAGYGAIDLAAATLEAALADRAPGALFAGVLPAYAAVREREEVMRRLSEAGLSGSDPVR